jgi:thioredoxin 1
MAAEPGKLHEMKSYEELNEFLSHHDQLRLVEYSAFFCKPCKAMEPEVAKLAEEHKDAITVAKIDVSKFDEHPETETCDAMPTFRFYKGGKVVGEVRGANMEELTAKFNEVKAAQ